MKVEKLKEVLSKMNLRNAEKYLKSEKDQMQTFFSKFKSSKPVQAVAGFTRSASFTNLTRKYDSVEIYKLRPERENVYY